jgi:predicted transcriptional regulator
MNEYGVRRVLITRGAELVGVISLDNVIEAMAEIMNNLNSLLVRQIENEQQHLVSGNSRESAA